MKKVICLFLSIAMLVTLFMDSIVCAAPAPFSTETLTISVESVNTSTGTQINVPINFTYIPAKGISIVDMTITYNPDHLEYISSDAGIIVPNKVTNFATNKLYDGAIKFLFLDYTMQYEAIQTAGNFANLCFKVLSCANNSSEINVTALVQDIDLNNIPTKTVPGLINNLCTSETTSSPSITPTPTPHITPFTLIPTPTFNPNEFTIELGTVNTLPNENVTVPINFKNTPEKGVSTLDMTIYYDPNCLEYLSYESGSIIPSPKLNFAINNPSKGTLKFLFLDYTLSNKFISSDGLFANLNFKVLGPSGKSTSLNVTNASSGDSDLNYLYSAIVSGMVNISDNSATTPNPPSKFTVIVDSQDSKTGKIINIPVTLSNIPDKGISTCDLTISYDPTKLDFLNSEPGGIVNNPNRSFRLYYIDDKTIKIVFNGDTTEGECITFDGVFAILSFKVLETSDASTSVEIIKSRIKDLELNIIIPSVVPGIFNITAAPIPTPTPVSNFAVNIGSTEGKTGDIISVPVSFTNIPSNGISSAGMNIYFDESKLEYLALEPGNIVPNLLTNKKPDGTIMLFATNANQTIDQYIKENGLFATISFKVIGSYAESTSIQLDTVYFTDKNQLSINAALNPGTVKIISSSTPPPITPTPPTPTKPFQITIDSSQGNKGDFVTVPVNFTNVPANEISTCDLTITYDPTILEYVSLDAGNIVDAPNINFEGSNPSKGFLRLLFIDFFNDNSCINEDGIFAYITFKVLDASVNSTLVSVSDSKLFDKNLSVIKTKTLAGQVDILRTGLPPTNYDFQVNIGSTQGSLGEIITVPVSFANVPVKGLSTFDMTINYDPSQLEYLSYLPGSVVQDAITNFAVIKKAEGVLNSLYLDYTFSGYIPSDGLIVNLTFRVLVSSGESTVEIDKAIFGDRSLDKVDAIFLPGKISILDTAPKGYTISGYINADLAINASESKINEGFKVELADSAFSSTTDSNGYFEIKAVPTGNYIVSITKKNYLKRQSECILVNKNEELSTSSNPIVLWAGDLEINNKQDGAINMEDIMEICKVFNSVSGDENYIESVDFSKDGAINMEDIMLVAKHFNKISSNY